MNRFAHRLLLAPLFFLPIASYALSNSAIDRLSRAQDAFNQRQAAANEKARETGQERASVTENTEQNLGQPVLAITVGHDRYGEIWSRSVLANGAQCYTRFGKRGPRPGVIFTCVLAGRIILDQFAEWQPF